MATNCQSWLVAPVQACSTTAVPLAVEPPAALAHKPEPSFTTSYHDAVLMPECATRLNAWAEELLQVDWTS